MPRVDKSPRFKSHNHASKEQIVPPSELHMSAIQIKRVYDPFAKEDGARFLVERLWPPGMKKEAVQMDAWCRDVAPSGDLRRWFNGFTRFNVRSRRPALPRRKWFQTKHYQIIERIEFCEVTTYSSRIG